MAHRLATALAMPTVSRAVRMREDHEAFRRLQKHLKRHFPLAHGVLTRERIVAENALLYTWNGSDEALEPWLLSSHQDVVPVEEGTEAEWTYPPFGGCVAEGYIWGRGALDLKVSLVGAIEAVEQLLSQGFRPRRTIYFSFGADEEVGGTRGAKQIAARLEARGVRLAFTLDEGGMVLSGAVPGVERPVAFVGVAEKGELLLRLRSDDAGGHSSMPSRTSSIGRLAHAMSAVEDHPLPAGLDPPMPDTFAYVAPHARQPYRTIYHKAQIFAPLLLRLLRDDPLVNAVTRTTTVATMVEAGVADNVVPGTATAVINARVKPGDSVADVESHLQDLVKPYGITIEILEAREASHVSSIDSGAFRTLCKTISQVMPDTVAVPFLSLNATDSRYYEPLARNQYRFVPVRVSPKDLRRIHGIDERISVENYGEVIRFLIEFIRNADRL